MKKQFLAIGSFLRARPRLDWLFVALLLALFVGLAAWNLTAGSIWFDEAFSAYLMNYNFIDIARYTATDVHPPLYYWLLKAWTMVFGETEIGLRSMSIFFGVIAAIFGYLFVKKQFGRKAALVALSLMILSPLFIRYGQEARMYTLAAAIIFAASYVLLLAGEAKKRSLWVLYGVLISLGMWTHYFTALIWLSHWAWRYLTLRTPRLRGKKLARAFFDKNWLTAHIVAVALFLPWLPAMAVQLVIIQTQGFWIGQVGLDTVGSYFGTIFYFLQSFQVTGWFSAALLGLALLVTVFAVRIMRKSPVAIKKSYLLILCMAFVSPLLLFVVSLPPLTPSFVERYLLPAALSTMMLVAITLVIGLRGRRIVVQSGVYIVVVAMLIAGIGNMYFYNNYNKNSGTGIETRAVVQTAMDRAAPGEPIIANSPWVFYEAIFYRTDRNPIYFIDEQVNYLFGSLDMLEYDDTHKIKDLDAFIKDHPTVWYIGNSQDPLTPPRDKWVKIDEFAATNRVDGKSVYRGAQFKTQ